MDQVIKAQEKIPSFIKENFFISEVIILQYNDFKVFNKKLDFFQIQHKSLLVVNLLEDWRVLCGQITLPKEQQKQW